MKLTFVLFLTLRLLAESFGQEDDVPDSGWVEEALRRHNEFRRGFNAPPLILNATLCESSLLYARELAKRDDDRDLEHSDMGYGENIYKAKGKDVEVYGSTPVDRWYDEIENFMRTQDKDNAVDNGEEEFDDSAIGSFTQLVWKSTKQMCISYAASIGEEEDDPGVLYVVAHYFPRGNTEEEEENLTPLISSPYFYPDSDSAPQPPHLSEPIGSDGTIIRTGSEHPERNCWKHWAYFYRNAINVTTSSVFIEEALSVTNHLRYKHRVGHLPILDEDCMLCKSAQGWANALVSNGPDTNWTKRHDQSACTQLVYSSKKFIKAEQLIKIWYNEGMTYEFYHHRTYDGTDPGNFIRLLWKGSEQFCVAYAKNGTNGYVYVGVVYQDPQPNYDKISARIDNVFSSAPTRFATSTFCLILFLILAILY